MEDAEDVRLKRLNKLQQSPALSSPVQTPATSSLSSSSVKGSVVSVDHKELDVKQPVAKATTVTPTKKVVEKVPPPVKVDCMYDVCCVCVRACVCACACMHVCVNV